MDRMTPSQWHHPLSWISLTLRWLALIGLALSSQVNGAFRPGLAGSFLTLALVNLGFSLFLLLSERQLTAVLVVALDLFFAPLIFVLSGGPQGSLAWSSVLPVLSAALTLPIPGTFGVALLATALQGLAAWPMTSPLAVFFLCASLLPLNLGLGIALNLLKQRLTLLPLTEQRAQVAGEPSEKEQRKALLNLIASLNASLNYLRVLETALDHIPNVLTSTERDAASLLSLVLLFQAEENGPPLLNIAAARGLPSADLRTTLPGAAGLVGETIEEAAPQLSSSVAQDPELNRLVGLHACQSAYCLPLRTGLDTYGVLLFAHPDPGFFTPARREILDSVNNQIAIAIQNARLYQDLEQEKERMMEIQEEARKKMARDLHDGPTQTVAAIAMRVNFARRLMERDQTAAAEELFKIEDMARRTTKEIRHMLFTLRPLVLESQGLVAALESMAEKMHETYHQVVVIEADPALVNELELPKQGVVFAIAEEAANNARKHARAAHIWVRLKKAQKEIALLEIEDDGAGFDAQQVNANYENRGSLGMVNMRERTELVNGLFKLDSHPGQGTRVRVWIPLSEEAADRLRHGV